MISSIVRRQFQGRNHPLLRAFVASHYDHHTGDRFFATRRKRQPVGATKYKEATEEVESLQADVGGLSDPYQHDQADINEYLKKASLSPFVPVPDPVARKMLELAQAGKDDIHIELGSGDGRVCFHAVDPPFSVKRSIGVDIDEKLIGISNDRLEKRYPKPNIEFRTADLMDNETSIWKELSNATVITMYFVEDALQKLRPSMEMALAGKNCRVVTCGYAMPGWEPRVVETILGLNIYFYHWGNKTKAYEPRPLTAEERAQAIRERQVVEQPLEEIQPQSHGYEDAERIEIPFYDETEEIDYYWDDFDEEEEDEDPDENLVIARYRNSK